MIPNMNSVLATLDLNNINTQPIKGNGIMHDPVNHPRHYCNNGIEVINVIEAFTKDLHGVEAVDTGNVIKYICRWRYKNGLEDLRKAQWYLDHLINKVSNEQAKMKYGEEAFDIPEDNNQYK